MARMLFLLFRVLAPFKRPAEAGPRVGPRAQVYGGAVRGISGGIDPVAELR